jgi:hypothetical protein
MAVWIAEGVLLAVVLDVVAEVVVPEVVVAGVVVPDVAVFEADEMAVWSAAWSV